MPETNDYRELINEKFSRVYAQMTANFDLIHTKLGTIESQFESQDERTDDRISKVEDKVETMDKDLEEYRVAKRYPKFTAGAIVLVGIGVVLLWLAQMGVI